MQRLEAQRPALRRAHCSARQTQRAVFLCCFAALSLGAGSLQGRQMSYLVDLEQAHTQRIEVTLAFELSGPLRGARTVDVAMPAWRPGRYVILDHAGGVIAIDARDGSGREREIEKLDKATWRVDSAGAERLEVQYTLYANSLGLRTRHADDSHAFLSGSAVFLYVEALRAQPLDVRFAAPSDWRIASGLEAAPGDSRALIAPNFDVLIDSPIEIGLHDRITFEAGGKPHEYIIWPPGRRYDRDRLVADTTAIIENHKSIFGTLPYQRYVFMVHAGAGARGGTEHLNSTIMQVPLDRLEGSLRNDDAYRGFLGLISHEFFHTWNVKQLRPSTMAPYELQEENYSTLFWVAEGTTSYYDSLTLARTERIAVSDYLEEVSELIDNSRTRPGTRVQSLSDSSYDAWVKFNRSTPDAANTTVSFYSQGALANLVIDLLIRQQTNSRRSLDDVMRLLVEQHPLESGGFSRRDLEATLASVSGSDWSGFFARHIDGVEPLPFEETLTTVGLQLVFDPDKPRGGAKLEEPEGAEEESDRSDEPRRVADTGVSLRAVDGKATVRSVRAGSAFFDAGLVPGDEIVALNGERVAADDWRDLVESYQPGSDAQVHFVRHGRLRELEVKLGERLAGTWVVERVEKPSPEQRAAYEDWLEEPWPESSSSAEDDG